jgi:hypothetical protein
MAYFLSKLKTGPCISNHLVKFDPLSFSTSPIWAKEPILSGGGTNADCGHLGLVFGRSELFLYAFSWYNNLGRISFVDITGVQIWQYTLPGSDRITSNLI